ncbi:MAG: mercury transporter MerT [Alteromonadaceae bacterium]|nr:mercury transporter MerT [Alteromonadaceae bacterium]
MTGLIDNAIEKPTTTKTPLFFAIFAGIGASACCIGPLLLLSLGVSGAWIGNLTAMEPYSGYFSAVTLFILVLVFKKLYITPPRCKANDVCANPKVLTRQRIIFWLVSIMLITMMSFPYYADYIFE